MLDLLLLRKNLLVEQIDLLGWGRIVVVLGLLAGCWGFTTNIVK